MPLPADFETECLYRRDQWYVTDLLDIGESHVHGLVDTTAIGAVVEAQVETLGHPKHVPGAVMVQITGTLGNLHAVYALGLKISEGWAGFGTHIRGAKFPSIGRIGPPVDVFMQVTRHRRFRGQHFCTYAFTYTQEGREIYVSEQSAIWFQGAPGAIAAGG